jgi:cellulose synthase/poly-beta-1,6-N-acetylglucosamine synthase-like glycosyltransferase
MVEASENPLITRVAPPKKTDIIIIRFLICCALACMALFLYWFINRDHIGHPILYSLLTFALAFKLIKMLHEWYHYWSPSVPTAPELKTKWTVDVLTTFCPGEPYDMMNRTLRAMVAIRYPHTNYLCDEADDPYLKQLCKELGIVHVTRKEKINAKAGNINNALKQATGDIAIVLDPDHVPIPEFIARVLPYFEDPEIGYVQSVQAYSNQNESIIARGAAEQTYHFYGPMMMCMNTYGTVQAIGANCAFRRKALDSIGGHAAGLSEDMHTAMQLHAKGWKSVYIPEILTRGLVPGTLSGYYKQQLKWSRGTFELLFKTIPDLWKNLTWRQKIHYITIPMYFLFGLVNLIDILVPVLALTLSETPWAVDVMKFGSSYIPLCMISLLCRFYAQRWLLEKHEKGFHLAGGLLRSATWWIFLIGFVYSIFNIKVPYIPTPKEDEHQNFWKLSITNMVVVIVCTISIFYGLSIDWSPYSFAMAAFSSINVLFLGFIIIMSQQKLLETVEHKVKSVSILNRAINGIEQLMLKAEPVLYGAVKNGPLALLLAISLLFLGYSSIDKDAKIKGIANEKKLGGFYAGISLPAGDTALGNSFQLERKINRGFDVVNIYESWRPEAMDSTEKQLELIRHHGAIPMITWLPDAPEQKICQLITSGKYDFYFTKYAERLRAFKDPIFINFAPGFDNPEKSWSVFGSNSASEFKNAWQYIYSYFNERGISNVSWIWSPETTRGFDYYPGSEFVDWLGFSCLNYGVDKKKSDWHTFSELYSPFRIKFNFIQKPVMITQLGCLKGPEQGIWFDDAFDDISDRFKEVKSTIIYNEQREIVLQQNHQGNLYIADFELSNKESIPELSQSLKAEPFARSPILKTNLNYLSPDKSYKSAFVRGKPGEFELLIDSKPYYIKGVAYNTAHDWRDGNMPLTRKQIEHDLEQIKAMGANTLRRYGSSVYNTNILNIANDYGLKVMYGFWFDPKVDYYRDSLQVKEYIEQVEEEVLEYKDNPSVLGWSLGNESWGLLKHTFGKPYLTKVREHYVKLIEHLAQRVHELDPTRPVFTCMEHEEHQLPGEIAALHDGAPSVDVIGINSYYKEQISQLQNVTHQFDPLRPYLVSEFGPRGYWNPTHNSVANGLVIEESETEKANWMKYQWNTYVRPNKGYNVGGVAYCWHERMEGSLTWFGISDYQGRLKPSYYSLAEVWAGKKHNCVPQFTLEPQGPIEPGKVCTFKAIPKSEINQELSYEWTLYRDSYLEEIENINTTGDDRIVRVEIPETPSEYRLYLYISDEQGNVSTVSTPFRINNKN